MPNQWFAINMAWRIQGLRWWFLAIRPTWLPRPQPQHPLLCNMATILQVLLQWPFFFRNHLSAKGAWIPGGFTPVSSTPRFSFTCSAPLHLWQPCCTLCTSASLAVASPMPCLSRQALLPLAWVEVSFHASPAIRDLKMNKSIPKPVERQFLVLFLERRVCQPCVSRSLH